MKKTMILMAACLVAGTAAAQESPVDDWGANWFLSAKGGVSAFIGKPVGHGDLFDREKPLLNVSVGKWFTPHVAGRLAFQGLQLKDANMVSCNYQNLHVDFLYNLTAHSDGMQKWDIIPYAGCGLIPLIVPIGCPLWMLALACAFSVIFCKEIFGGTGMNLFNPAIAARMFLFFAYPSVMTGDKVWVAQDSIFGLGNTLPDTFTAATPLGQIAQGITPDTCICDMIFGFIPGSIGETSVIAIAIGAVILLWTGIASWRTMLSVFVGGAAMGILFESVGATTMPWWHHFVLGGFAFGAVFMATDPVTSCRTEGGKYIYGFIIGAMAIIIRVQNAGYPEGMMLAIFFGNMIAPMIDHFIVERNISKRLKRGGTK